MFSIRFNRSTAGPCPALAFAALADARLAVGADAGSSRGHIGAVPDQERPEVADHVRQLSGRPPRQRRARRHLGCGVLSLGAAQRSQEQRAARPRLHLLARRRRHRRGGQARRPHPDHRQIQPRRPPRGRRARSEAEEIRHRADQHQPVDPRTDHRPGGDAAVGLGQLRRRRHQGGGRQYRQADRSGVVSDLQGPAFRHDPRTRGQGKGSRRAAGARLQARRFHAAGGRCLCALAVAQQGPGGGHRGLRGVRQEAGAASAGAGRPARDQGRQEAAAAGGFAAGRRRRGAVRHRRHADPPRRRGSRAGLSAALALSRSPTIRWRCCRSPISTSR